MTLKWLVLIVSTLLIETSCSRKLHPNYKSIDDVNAVIINKITDNRKFIPAEKANDLYVRVHFVSLLDENGDGNFKANNEEDNASLKRVFKKANALMVNLKDPKDSICYTGSDFLASSKVQFEFKKLFIIDTFSRNYLNSGYTEKNRRLGLLTPSKNWYLKKLDDNINDTIRQKGIMIYNTMNADAYDDLAIRKSEKGYNSTKGVAISQFPSYTDFERSSQLNYPNWYLKRLWIEQFYCPKNNITWKSGRGAFEGAYSGMAHELGHSLGLYHSNKYHGTNKCKNGLMHQSWKSKRNYIQPTEIGKIHKALMTSNLIQFVTDDSNYGLPKIISENENWDFKKIRFYQDIIVEEGNVLILNGTVILPKTASITLKKHAILILNNAQLVSVDKLPFTNIIKERHAKVIEY